MDRKTVLLACGAVALLAGLILLGSMSVAQPPLTHAVDVNAGPVAVSVQGAELPEDGKRYCVSILVNDDWQQRPAERQLVAWWQVHPYLRSLATQTTHDVYTPKDPRYQKYFGRAIRQSDLPVVLVQDGSGKVHWKASRLDMPRGPDEMAQSVGKLFKSRPYYLLPWRRPKPCPEPRPCPTPVEPTPVEVQPIFEVPPPAPEPEQPDATVAVAVVLLVLGGLIGIVGGIVAGIKSRAG